MKAADKVTPQDFAGICGIYWEGSVWYDVLPADCATQGDVDLGKLCPVYACAKERGPPPPPPPPPPPARPAPGGPAAGPPPPGPPPPGAGLLMQSALHRCN